MRPGGVANILDQHHMNAERERDQFEQLLRAFQVAETKPTMEMEKYANLLDAFQRLPQSERTRRKTLLEIAGVSRREAAHSNILAFLLRQDEEHGLGDLVLRSLLKAADQNTFLETLPAKHIEVTREDPTDDRKRIDIVVETPSFVLGIENKVLARVENPFGEYRRRLEETGKRWIGEKDHDGLHGFKPVTYAQLFSAIRTNLGPMLSSATSQHLAYLLDFIETLDNLRLGVDMMDPSIREFFRQNEDVAHRFFNKAEELLNELKWRGKQMKDVKLPKPELRLQSEKWDKLKFTWTTWVEVDLSAGVMFGAQVVLSLRGWEVATYCWYKEGGKNARERIEGLFKERGASLGP
jgi:PD-(D/E)XK nuclease superfamily